MSGGGDRQQVQSRYQARITTIFPAMYCKGIQSRAESSFCSPRKEQVRQALSIMRSFSTYSSLGLPVEPEVCTAGCLPGQTIRKERRKVPAGSFGCRQGYSFLPFNFPVGVGDAFYQNGLFVSIGAEFCHCFSQFSKSGSCSSGWNQRQSPSM